MLKNNILREKTLDFAEKVIELYKELIYTKKEYVLSKQILKSATSIGANIVEAVHGQSKADFYAKLKIAEKEAAETAYWLELLKRGEYLSLDTFYKLTEELLQIQKIIAASCKTTINNMEKARTK